MNREKSKQRLIYNSFSGFVDKFAICIMGLLLRRIFIQYMGAELSGLSSLFQNIIEFLNLATAGFSTALFPRLYKYNAENDYESIRKITCLAKQFYGIVSLFIFVLGVGCSFFVDKMIYANRYSLFFLRVVFMMQVLTQCVRMLSTPYVNLLQARECGYVNNICDLIMNVFVYIMQFLVIFQTQNYMLYLLVALLGYILYVVGLSIQVNRMYPWLKMKFYSKVDKIAGLFGDLKNTVLMQIANFIFCSTDNVVISGVLGLVVVNAYGNYMTIVTALTGILATFTSAIKEFYGNKLKKSSLVSDKEAFLDNATFLFYFFTSIISITFYCLIDDLIQVWLGKEYIQNSVITVLFSYYLFFFVFLRAPEFYLQNFGEFKKELKSNLSSAIINIILSLVLVQICGITGVLIGTLVGFVTRFIQRSYYSFDSMRSDHTVQYWWSTMCYVGSFSVLLFCEKKLCKIVNVDNVWVEMMIKGILVVFSVSIINLVIFYKKKGTKEILAILRKLIFKGKSCEKTNRMD